MSKVGGVGSGGGQARPLSQEQSIHQQVLFLKEKLGTKGTIEFAKEVMEKLEKSRQPGNEANINKSLAAWKKEVNLLENPIVAAKKTKGPQIAEASKKAKTNPRQKAEEWSNNPNNPLFDTIETLENMASKGTEKPKAEELKPIVRKEEK